MAWQVANSLKATTHSLQQNENHTKNTPTTVTVIYDQDTIQFRGLCDVVK